MEGVNSVILTMIRQVRDFDTEIQKDKDHQASLVQGKDIRRWKNKITKNQATLEQMMDNLELEMQRRRLRKSEIEKADALNVQKLRALVPQMSTSASKTDSPITGTASLPLPTRTSG